MEKKQKTFSLLAVCLASACLLCGCRGEKLPEDLAAYSLDGEQIASINAVLDDEELGTHLSEVETPEEKEEDKAEDEAADGDGPSETDEDSSPAEEIFAVYSYSGLEGTGELVLHYVEALTKEEEGFRVVDDTGAAAEPPDYARETGEILLARQSDKEGQLLQIAISWEETGLRVTLSRVNESGQPEVEPMTNVDAVDYLKGLSPTKLGLPGNSMGDYQIYPMDGAVQVDGVPCLKLQVYRLHLPENSNDIAGIFLLAGDRSHLYRLENGQVTELDVL